MLRLIARAGALRRVTALSCFGATLVIRLETSLRLAKEDRTISLPVAAHDRLLGDDRAGYVRWFIIAVFFVKPIYAVPGPKQSGFFRVLP